MTWELVTDEDCPPYVCPVCGQELSDPRHEVSYKTTIRDGVSYPTMVCKAKSDGQ